ncbi:MAG: glycine zipper 2TM domain-containing protein [Pseudomonadota bacterium]
MAVLLLPLAAYATEYRTVEQPRQECWNEQTASPAASPGYGGAIIGGLAGGLLGNQVGGGNGKTVATAVGAMTGAVVGDRMSGGAPSYQAVRRCRTVVERVRVPVPPVPTYYEPLPVVEQRVYYVEPAERWYGPQWRYERWHHKHWKHEHEHEGDDDDEHGHGRRRHAHGDD